MPPFSLEDDDVEALLNDSGDLDELLRTLCDDEEDFFLSPLFSFGNGLLGLEPVDDVESPAPAGGESPRRPMSNNLTLQSFVFTSFSD